MRSPNGDAVTKIVLIEYYVNDVKLNGQCRSILLLLFNFSMFVK